MPFREGGYTPKPPEELAQQLESAQQLLGNEQDPSLVPPSKEASEMSGLSLEEIKQKYALRYEMYTNLLRHQRSLDMEQEPHLSDEDMAEMKKWLIALNSLDGYITKHYGGEQTLRGRQINVFEDLRQFMEDGDKRGYVKLPTGVGKTVLFTEFVEALNLKTLIVVPRKLLVKQTADKMKEFAPDLEYGRVFSAAQEYGRQVTIITYDSLLSRLESGDINPDDYDAVMLDEAHKVLGNQRKNVLEKFDKQLIVGFTATPDFSERKKLSNVLPKEIHAMTVREAVEENMLCSVSSIVVRTEADLSSVQVDKDKYSKKQLEEAVNIESRNQAAIKLYQSQFDGQAAIAYCVGVRHAEVVAAEFNRAGVPAAAINGEVKSDDQDEILEKFKNGEIKVLCNAALLIEGFDEPEASVCLNLAPTLSRVDAEQRGGRVLRVNKNDPEKHATVVDFLDKGIAPENMPILFADVVDGALFLPEGKDEQDKGGKKKKRKEFIEIPGLDVVYSAEEVMRVVGKIREDKEKLDNTRTEEAALKELDEVFIVWLSIPKDQRSDFNANWLALNYSGLYRWINKTYGSLKIFVEKSKNEELKNFFKYQEQSENYTLEIALDKLELAFQAWLLNTDDNRGQFNSNWLQLNGYLGLYKWARDKFGDMKIFVNKSGNVQLKKEFGRKKKTKERQYIRRTKESSLIELDKAFKHWKSLSEKNRGNFSYIWLEDHGYKGLLLWVPKYFGSFKNFIDQSSNSELKDVFRTKKI